MQHKNENYKPVSLMTICAIDSLMFLSSTPALLYCVLYCWGLKSTNHISQLPLPAGCLLESATGNLKLLLENQKGQAERFSLWAPTVWQSLVVGTGKAERILNPEAWTKAPSFFLVPILVKTAPFDQPSAGPEPPEIASPIALWQVL